MTDIEISRQLALAIGYLPEHVKVDRGFVWVSRSFVTSSGITWETWQIFTHDDPSVIWPIAERFDCFPIRGGEDGLWVSSVNYSNFQHSDSAAKAVALAVISRSEGG